MSTYATIWRTSSTANSSASLRVTTNDYHQEARVLLSTAAAGKEAAKEADVQDAIRAYHALVPKRTIEEEEAEEREWHAIVSRPDVQQSLHSFAEEIRRQIAAGETEEGGFAVE